MRIKITRRSISVSGSHVEFAALDAKNPFTYAHSLAERCVAHDIDLHVELPEDTFVHVGRGCIMRPTIELTCGSCGEDLTLDQLAFHEQDEAGPWN